MATFCLLAFLVAAASAAPSTLDINASGCGGNLVGYKYPDKFIVGGEEATPNAYPWMAAMYYRGSFRCGGSLIRGNNGMSYILTAAHCTVNTNANQWEMRLGRHNLAATESNTRQHINVDQVINNPSYSSSTYNWDISLLRLSSNPTDTAYVRPGCFPIGDISSGENSFVSGWGALSEGGSSPSRLQVVSKPILAHQTCRDQLGSNSYYESNMLCAGFDAGGSDACQGDSGGPLMAIRGGRVEIVGVVSWGYGCARPERPGVYSNSVKSKSWVNGIINN
ncbi:trypsin alpha-3-like [Haliotis rubra]|uniref:trypsin alpha-3-like n=1 Tax=Haliotis rubra TaxID=36100 RepID=UPI001EE55707|nr:trypsin alpha-3-like [Haliotis rubra]